ncbi:MAG: 5'-methylthioadenosine/adenosylhomocysteine nucleosidase [Angelakisella sp.]|nr:5'-methylthioadenosine/adenosylhomocysteine nucleosidase [Angelakisella sp.]
MKIGIMCATQRELAPLAEKMVNHTTQEALLRTYHLGKLWGMDTVAVMGGVGKVNAAITAQDLITRFGVEKIFFTGVAGGLSDEIKIGDVVIGTQLVNHDIPYDLINNVGQFGDMPREFFSDPDLVELCRGLSPNIHFGRILTGDAFITGAQRDDLINRFDPLCVDMESAAVAQVCWFFQTPLLIIRSLSDNADDDAGDVYEQNIANSCKTAAGVLQVVLQKLAQ